MPTIHRLAIPQPIEAFSCCDLVKYSQNVSPFRRYHPSSAARTSPEAMPAPILITIGWRSWTRDGPCSPS